MMTSNEGSEAVSNDAASDPAHNELSRSQRWRLLVAAVVVVFVLVLSWLWFSNSDGWKAVADSDRGPGISSGVDGTFEMRLGAEQVGTFGAVIFWNAGVEPLVVDAVSVVDAKNVQVADGPLLHRSGGTLVAVDVTYPPYGGAGLVSPAGYVVAPAEDRSEAGVQIVISVELVDADSAGSIAGFRVRYRQDGQKRETVIHKSLAVLPAES
jgi:hypothetical protein